MFSTIFYALDGDIGEEFSNSGSSKYYTSFGTDILTGDGNDLVFIDLGFEIHYIGEVDNKGHEFGYDDLKDGDIVVAYRSDDVNIGNRGHVEFYINNRYDKNGNGTYDWSFGWGSKKKRYPVNGNIGKKVFTDDNQSDINKKKYLLDNFTNLTYDGDKNGVPDRTYELRYFKVLRKAQ